MSVPSLLDDLIEPKPAYSVPSMADVKAMSGTNGLTAVSTFSGCGGSSLGMRMAGFSVPYAVEFTPLGAETYRANSDAYVDERDVRQIQAEDILDHLGFAPGELDLFEGSPPCSAFSSSAAQTGGYAVTKGKVKPYSEGISQRVDDLFDEWLRLVEGIRAKAIIAENVPDLAKPGEAAGYLHSITDRLSEIGYDVHAEVYSSSAAGAATWRKRLVILGVRRDVGAVPRPRLHGVEYSLRDAIETLPIPIPEDELDHAFADDSRGRPRQAMADHWERCLRPFDRMHHTPETCQVPREDGKHSALFNLKRAQWDKPLMTVTTVSNGGSLMHPDECRYFTATEVAWISGFPADFHLAGKPANRYERIGRAVTPPLYRALTPYLADVIKGTSCAA